MAREFGFNNKIADKAIEHFNKLIDGMDYQASVDIGMALTKLKLLEEQGIKKARSDYEYINHPLHYLNDGRECIDEMIDIFGIEAVADWCDITAYKYQFRKGKKPNAAAEEDEKKAEWYLKKAKELRANDKRGDEEYITSSYSGIS